MRQLNETVSGFFGEIPAPPHKRERRKTKDAKENIAQDDEIGKGNLFLIRNIM